MLACFKAFSSAIFLSFFFGLFRFRLSICPAARVLYHPSASWCLHSNILSTWLRRVGEQRFTGLNFGNSLRVAVNSPRRTACSMVLPVRRTRSWSIPGYPYTSPSSLSQAQEHLLLICTYSWLISRSQFRYSLLKPASHYRTNCLVFPLA